MERGHRRLAILLAAAVLAAPAGAKPSGRKPQPAASDEKGIMTEAAERARKDFDPEACLVGADVMSGFRYDDVDPADDRQLVTYYGNSFAFWFRSPARKGEHAQRFCSPAGSTPPKGGFGPKLCFAGFNEWWSDDQEFEVPDSPCIRSVRVPIAQALELGGKIGLKPGEQGLRARLLIVRQPDPARKRLAILKGKTVWLLRGEGTECLAINGVSGKQLYFGGCEGLPW